MINLQLRTYVDGINDPIFGVTKYKSNVAALLEDGIDMLLENSNNVYLEKDDTYFFPVSVGEYTYAAQRMGAVPSISATIMFWDCLDSLWTGREYIVYNDERYYVFNTPNSSKNNSDGRYKHEVTFYSERYELNGIYFFDVLGEDSSYAGGFISNSSKVYFYGGIDEFAERLQASLDYNNIDYKVVVDYGISSEAVAVSLEDVYVLDALQQSFELYNIPHYFKGREIHFGYTDNVIPEVLEYGDSLLEITKTNANFKKVTYCSGVGSSENIPYYYPNITDVSIYKNKIYAIIQDDIISTCSALGVPVIDYIPWWVHYGVASTTLKDSQVPDNYTTLFDMSPIHMSGETVSNRIKCIVTATLTPSVSSSSSLYLSYTNSHRPVSSRLILKTLDRNPSPVSTVNEEVIFDGVDIDDTKKVYITYQASTEYYPHMLQAELVMSVTAYYEVMGDDWVFNPDTVIDYIQNTLIPNNPDYTSELNALLDRTQAHLDEANQPIDRMPTVQNLMPSIFRETNGAQRFYPAKNNTYLLPDGSGKYYEFENENDSSIIKEQVIENFDDIKPTIKGITNAAGQLIGTITDFAYDDDDNDDPVLDADGNATEDLQHPYFYMKLKKFDGEHGFNMFASSIDSGEMTIIMQNGNLAGTEHIVQSVKREVVGSFEFDNPVQVDGNGNIVAGNYQEKINTNNIQPQNQNTQTNEIWIAVTKNINQFSVLMPNVEYGVYPTAGDEFVITHIYLPQAYIEAAEHRLEQSIIQYMWENNTEKFNFTIKFSRVFLADNPLILSLLNENSRLAVRYDNKTITSYISSYTYKSPTSTDPLPEITVTITDTISVNSGALQNSLSEIKNDILSNSPTSADFLKLGLEYFLRKDVEDTAKAPVFFEQGVFSKDWRQGNFAGAGWGVYQKPDGTSVCEIDELVVRKTATFNELIINQISFTLGQTVFTNGGFEIKEVEEADEYYRCYYDNKEGSRFAGVIPGDFVRCQEYDESFSMTVRYYSRLVVGVGDDYVDLSKTHFNGVGAPKIGDNCVQWGNETNKDRQFAIIRNVTGGGYDQFLWGIDNVSSVGTEYYFVGWQNSSDPRLQFGDNEIGGLRCLLSFENISNEDGSTTIQPKVSLDIWANTLTLAQPDGSYKPVSDMISDGENSAISSFFGGNITDAQIEEMRASGNPFIWDTDSGIAYLKKAVIDKLATDTAFIDELIVKRMQTEGDKVVIESDGTIKAEDANISGSITINGALTRTPLYVNELIDGSVIDPSQNNYLIAQGANYDSYTVSSDVPLGTIVEILYISPVASRPPLATINFQGNLFDTITETITASPQYNNESRHVTVVKVPLFDLGSLGTAEWIAY